MNTSYFLATFSMNRKEMLTTGMTIIVRSLDGVIEETSSGVE